MLALTAQATPEAPPLALYVAAVDALVQWQTQTLLPDQPTMDAAVLLVGLQGFSHWYLGVYRKAALDATAQKVLDTACATIAAQCQNWPTVPVHQSFTPARVARRAAEDTGFGVLPAPSSAIGPVTYDIATLVRDPERVWDESFVLEVTIRYWERARKAGLPVGQDFGEFYRGMEWTGLQRHLTLVGQLACEAAEAGALTTGPAELPGAPVLLHYILATCSRYIELKPLMRLIERIEGLESAGGYAFGRV
ncbi:MAG: aminoglycoside phosphotransferase [Burkholderiales bacterium PBB3]|nr:MAG: aminoglycoside phosphotransferase [Burkholderiales bacterium PBB3]